jgi:hypothetical protein
VRIGLEDDPGSAAAPTARRPPVSIVTVMKTLIAAIALTPFYQSTTDRRR